MRMCDWPVYTQIINIIISFKNIFCDSFRSKFLSLFPKRNALHAVVFMFEKGLAAPVALLLEVQMQ